MSMRDDGLAIERGAPIEVRFADPDASKGEISGYAAIFNERTIDERIPFRVGAFAAGLRELAARGHKPALLLSHDPSKVIGRIVEISENAKGLRVRAQLNLETPAGRDAFEHIKAGDVGGLSPGYAIRKIVRDDTGNPVAIGDALVIEVSLVPLPAGLGAKIDSVRAIASERELARMLREGAPLARGLAAKVARAAFPALRDGSVEASVGVAEIVDLAKHIRSATRSRQTATRKFFKR